MLLNHAQNRRVSKVFGAAEYAYLEDVMRVYYIVQIRYVSAQWNHTLSAYPRTPRRRRCRSPGRCGGTATGRAG